MNLLFSYLFWLSLISIFVLFLERIFPARPHRVNGVLKDWFYLFFNGEIFGVCLAYSLMFIGGHIVWPDSLRSLNLLDGWPWLMQVLVFFVFKDFVDWWVHRLLHRYDFLWRWHRFHHTATEMDFLICFRFHWMETILYRTGGWLVLLICGMDFTAIFVCAVLSTLIGHLNHANLNFGYGWLGYIVNNPRFHIWHHELRSQGEVVCNFAINLSLWDYLFRTAYRDDTRTPILGIDDSPDTSCKLNGEPSLPGIIFFVLFWFWVILWYSH